MTKDVHEGNSLQEAHDILPVSVQPAQQSGCLITGDCRKYILTIFFHREILTARKGFTVSNKRGLSGSREKPSSRLGLPIALTVWFIAIVYPFQIF